MKKLFIFAVVLHKKLGYLLVPYIVTESGKPYYSIHERVNETNLRKYADLLTDQEKQMVKITSEYNDQNILKRFTNKNITVKDFLLKLDASYFSKHIRPFIEKQITLILEILCNTQTQLFFRGDKNNIYDTEKIKVFNKQAETVFHFQRNEEGTLYFQSIKIGNQRIKLTNKTYITLCNRPCALIMDHILYRFADNVDAKLLQPFFTKESIFVPRKIEKKYYSTFILQMVKNQEVTPEGFEIIESKSPVKAILSIEYDWLNEPALVLSYRYGEQMIHADSQQKLLVSMETDNERYRFYRFRRDDIFEKNIHNKLHRLGLVKTTAGIYKPASIDEKENKLYKLIEWIRLHRLSLEQMKIDIQQKYLDVKYFTGAIELNIQLKKEKDWFDIYGTVRFGNEFEIPFINLRKHLAEGERAFELPNGEIALLPEEWFAKYKDIVLFGRRHKNNLQLNQFHYPMLLETGISISKTILKSVDEIFHRFGDQQYEVPSRLNASLRPYQVEGFNWLNLLSRFRLGACLADDMGLGKTIQSLAVLLYNKMNTIRTISGTVSTAKKSGQLSLFGEEKINISTGTSLVIMPTSLIQNWIHEIRKFTPDMNFYAYSGMHREKFSDKLFNYDIVLTTYGIVRNDIEILKSYVFDYLILDESQLIKNPRSKAYQAINQLNARNRIVLTGTPIENSLSDLWSQMNFINKGLLGSLHFFREYFLIPIEKHDDENRKYKLQQIIRPFIMRRTKQEVARELPPLTQEVYYCGMTEEQRSLYLLEKSKIRNLVLDKLSKDGVEKSSFIVLQALTRLRQLANHPRMIEQNYRYSSGKFEEVCRNTETLIKENHKVLIFSAFVKHLNIFSGFFDSMGWNYAMLTGSTTEREDIIRDFKDDASLHLFLISLKAGGLGLNLTEAEYVFLLEPWWNPAVEMQAVSRAHRIKQDKNVFVYRFITSESIEEKILQLQQKKSILSGTFINASNPLKSFSSQDIEELLE